MDISGDITFCGVEYDMSNNITMITITTESYDKVSHNIFNEINFMFNKKLKISFVEVSGENCYKHNEGAYPHECCVLADGSPFELLCYDPILTIDDAIDYWFKKMKLNKLNKTQKELAERTGIRPPTISAICNNSAKHLPIDALDKICEVLDCQPSDLMEYIKTE